MGRRSKAKAQEDGYVDFPAEGDEPGSGVDRPPPEGPVDIFDARIPLRELDDIGHAYECTLDAISTRRIRDPKMADAVVKLINGAGALALARERMKTGAPPDPSAGGPGTAGPFGVFQVNINNGLPEGNPATVPQIVARKIIPERDHD